MGFLDLFRAKTKPAPLFDDEEEVDAKGGFTVNKSFAKSFEERKRKQDLSQARERGLFDALRAADGEADSEEEESEDDGAALTTTWRDPWVIGLTPAARPSWLMWIRSSSPSSFATYSSRNLYMSRNFQVVSM